MEAVKIAIVFISTFLFMEFMAWFSHKYIMHGFLWSLHKDHHNQNLKTSWWERNDLFFVMYALVSMGFFYSQVELKKLITDNGFSNVEYRNLSNGISAIHSGWKI